MSRRSGRLSRLVAFTLLECLVAMAVLTIMVVLMASVASHVSKAWRDVNAANQRRSVARIPLQFMARELQALCPPVPMPGAAQSPANLQFVANLPVNTGNATAIPADVLNPHALFWQALDSKDGSIVETGYFVRWDTASKPGNALPQFCRFFVGPHDSADYIVYNQVGGVAENWLNMLPKVTTAKAPDYQGLMSDNVLALWVRCLDVDGLPITRNAAGQILNGGYGFDSRQGYREPASGKIHPPPAWPPCVEISLVTIDTMAASRLKSPVVPTVNSPENFDKDANTPGSLLYFMANLPPEARSGAQAFSTRVFLPMRRQR